MLLHSLLTAVELFHSPVAFTGIIWASFEISKSKKCCLTTYLFALLLRNDVWLKALECFYKYTFCSLKLANDVTGLRESEEKLKQQQQESARRENILVMRLATKEQEMQECTVSD